MRSCGSCTLCCKLAVVLSIAKRANEWCRFCEIGKGCRIYPMRPQDCIDFRCGWLDGQLLEEHRPDRIGFYVSGHPDAETVNVFVDPGRPDAWSGGPGEKIIAELSTRQHVIVVSGRQLNFVQSPARDLPGKLMVEWFL